jgi:hypothetical protein
MTNGARRFAGGFGVHGGVVITEAGNDPKVAGLVYIASFAPDKGESVSSLFANPAPGAPVPPFLPPKDGFLLLDKPKFAASFAADVKLELASFMANSQVSYGVDAVGCCYGTHLEGEAELIPGRDLRQDDSGRCPTWNGETGWRYDRQAEC